MKRTAAALLAVSVAAVALTACSSVKAYPDQIAYVIGNGSGDFHKVKEIVYPGTKVHTDGDEVAWYIPSGARNWRVGNKGDDHESPSVAYTGAATDGSYPRMQDNVYLTMNWAINQNKDALTQFATFCGKYTCYDTEGNVDHSGDAHSSSAGWFNMLNENMQPAVDRAVSQALQQFGPDLWSDQSQWEKLGTAVSAAFMATVKTGWSSIGTADFFCGNGDQSRDGSCAPVQVIIDRVSPSDPRVEQTAKDAGVLDQQGALNAQKIAQAKEKYGPYWQYFLGIQDTIAACATKQACTVVVGNPGTVPGAS